MPPLFLAALGIRAAIWCNCCVCRRSRSCFCGGPFFGRLTRIDRSKFKRIQLVIDCHIFSEVRNSAKPCLHIAAYSSLLPPDMMSRAHTKPARFSSNIFMWYQHSGSCGEHRGRHRSARGWVAQCRPRQASGWGGRGLRPEVSMLQGVCGSDATRWVKCHHAGQQVQRILAYLRAPQTTNLPQPLDHYQSVLAEPDEVLEGGWGKDRTATCQ